MYIDLTATLVKYPTNNSEMTHIDLFYTGKEMPMTSLITSCILLDARDVTSGMITMESVGGIEAVQKNDSVIIRTGWERYRGTSKYELCPQLDELLVKGLVDKGVCLVLIDSPGLRGGARGEEHNKTDKYLADNNAFAVENLVNTDKICKSRFTLYCFPLQMSQQNWAPCRVVVELD